MNKMSFLRGSANYVWCTTSVLGKGATGAVFQGVNRQNGEIVAVKTFNQISHMRPVEVQMREFEVLNKVKHENIVKLLAIEEEQEGRGKVIVMELCTGGSLFNLLDDPENSYGLEEDEWLLVLSHLSAGMNHLRDNNLIHRDLKPGNIMKFIKDDGSVLYKLTDFGAARELEDDQQFVSLYGTEEYLHPDMYERAVLRKTAVKSFGATVDLWSIGVTLFHVATGSLPFRPFGGRRNKETMYHITTKKASGVISGVQTAENGPINWSRELPSSCLLSTGVKTLVTPLLAGLLEVNPNKKWSFEKFFNHVTWILKKKVLSVSFVNKLSYHRVYVDPTVGSKEFAEQLSAQIDVPPSDMICLYKEKDLIEYVQDNRALPVTSKDTSNPILVFNRQSNNISLTPINEDLPSYPTIFHMVSVENDAALAKSTTAVGYAYKRQIESYVSSLEVIEIAVSAFIGVVKKDLSVLSEKIRELQTLFEGIEDRIHFFNSSHDTLTKLLSESCSGSDSDVYSIVINCTDKFKVLKTELSELFPAVNSLNKRFVTENQLLVEWRESTKEFPFQSVYASGPKSRTYVSKLKDSWQHLLRDRASRTLGYNEEQFHKLEKIKMQETVKVLTELLKKETEPGLKQITEILADWYKMSQTTLIQGGILTKDVVAFSGKVKEFLETLKRNQEEYSLKINNMADSIPSALDSANAETKKIKSAVKSILVSQDEVWGIIRENTRLIEQFSRLLANSESSNDEKAMLLAHISDYS